MSQSTVTLNGFKKYIFGRRHCEWVLEVKIVGLRTVSHFLNSYQIVWRVVLLLVRIWWVARLLVSIWRVARLLILCPQSGVEFPPHLSPRGPSLPNQSEHSFQYTVQLVYLSQNYDRILFLMYKDNYSSGNNSILYWLELLYNCTWQDWRG